MRRVSGWWWVSVWVLAAGCVRFSESGDPLESVVGPDSVGDADTDTDADSDADTDTDTTLPQGPFNVVFILTDDQRFDSMAAMPATVAALGGAGWTFENALVNTPMCCPARASMLSGGYYANETGVHSNGLPNGGVTRFVDTLTLPGRLQAAGYRTGIVGKYLNEYPDIAPYVPPGWDHFEATLTEADWENFQVVHGSSGAEASTGTMETVGTYVTDFVTTEALGFLQDEDDGRPFFLFVSHSAPHYPFTPAPEDEGDWTGDSPQLPSFNEADRSDKPAFVQEESLSTAEIGSLESDFDAEMETLAAVDRSVTAILDALEAGGHRDDTVVIFASDNGLQLGEHQLLSKGYPYQESLRVPLIVRWPGLGTGTSDVLASASLDVPATIYDATEIAGPTRGRSLRGVLEGAADDWPDTVYIEGESESSVVPSWQGLVTHTWKYVEYSTGEQEYYDLVTDPYEMNSQHAASAYADEVAAAHEALDAVRGLMITRIDYPFSSRTFSSYTLEAVGGVAPLTWVLLEGELPAGISFDGVDTISGTPVAPIRAPVTFRVESSALSEQTGLPLEDTQYMSVSVDVPEASFTSPPTAHTRRGGARFLVPVGGGGPVTVQVGPSPEFDDNPKKLSAAPVAPGLYAAEITTLRPGETWYWRVLVGGRLVDHETRRFTVPR